MRAGAVQKYADGDDKCQKCVFNSNVDEHRSFEIVIVIWLQTAQHLQRNSSVSLCSLMLLYAGYTRSSFSFLASHMLLHFDYRVTVPHYHLMIVTITAIYILCVACIQQYE